MNNEVLIGIDLGTTGCRSMVFDGGLNILGEAYIEYPLIKITDEIIEQDAEGWWAHVRTTMRDALRAAGGHLRVKAIGVSSQGITIVPVDRDIRPLMNALSWLDTRAHKQLLEIGKRFSDAEIYRITGKRANEGYTLPKLLWLKENEPGIFKDSYKILMPHDFILARLCGEPVTDHTLAAGTLMYDCTRQQWAKGILETFGIAVEKLPEICWSGTAVGRIKKEVAEELGIDADAAVVCGGQDQKCAALGAGIGPGIITVSLGTAAAITQKLERPEADPEMRIPFFSDLLRGKWVREGVIGTAGAALKWLKGAFFENESYEAMDRNAMDVPASGKLFFYPHLNGVGSPEWYTGATGCFYGITLNTQKYDFVRALFEGVAFQIRRNVEFMSEGAGVDEIRLFGGGAKSDIWCRVIADVTGKKVNTLSTVETACAGAAMLAGMGAGIYKTEEALANALPIDKSYLPDPAAFLRYTRMYGEYTSLERKVWGDTGAG
jgi:xylulokinase